MARAPEMMSVRSTLLCPSGGGIRSIGAPESASWIEQGVRADRANLISRLALDLGTVVHFFEASSSGLLPPPGHQLVLVSIDPMPPVDASIGHFLAGLALDLAERAGNLGRALVRMSPQEDLLGACERFLATEFGHSPTPAPPGERLPNLVLQLGRPIRVCGVVPESATSVEISWNPVALVCLSGRRPGSGITAWNSVSVDVSGTPR